MEEKACPGCDFFHSRVLQQGLVGSSRDGLTAKLALTSLLNHGQQTRQGKVKNIP